MIKPGDFRCIDDEGMPRYKNPFLKGKLILKFDVTFPDFLELDVLQMLEQCLPPK